MKRLTISSMILLGTIGWTTQSLAFEENATDIPPCEFCGDGNSSPANQPTPKEPQSEPQSKPSIAPLGMFKPTPAPHPHAPARGLASASKPAPKPIAIVTVKPTAKPLPIRPNVPSTERRRNPLGGKPVVVRRQ